MEEREGVGERERGERRRRREDDEESILQSLPSKIKQPSSLRTSLQRVLVEGRHGSFVRSFGQSRLRSDEREGRASDAKRRARASENEKGKVKKTGGKKNRGSLSSLSK